MFVVAKKKVFALGRKADKTKTKRGKKSVKLGAKVKAKKKNRRGSKKSAAQKRLVNRVEKAAKKKGFSLFSWIRRGRFLHQKNSDKKEISSQKPLTKEDIKKVDASVIQKAREEPIIVQSPKFAYHDALPEPKKLLVSNTREEIKKEIAKRAEFDAKTTLSETQLRNPVLRTDFDNILRMINEEGTINAAIIQLRLGLSQSRLKECYKTLEAAGKIRVDYPLIGQPKLISIAFEKEKKKRELAKKGIQPEIEDETSE